MQYAHLNKIADAGAAITLGIVAPDGRQGMIEHAAQFHAASIPFIFDPGQGMPMFGGEELKTFIRQARWLTLNDYEWGMLQQKTGLTTAEVASQVEALIVTLGSEGSIIYTGGRTLTHSLRQTKSSNRPHGLRGCLSGWSNSRVAARPGLGNDRQDGLPDGRDQDRIARAAESPLYPDRV